MYSECRTAAARRLEVMMLRYLLSCLLLAGLLARAAGAEPTPESDAEARKEKWRSGIALASKPPVFGCRNPFQLSLEGPDFKGASDVSEILVQVYDPEESRWRGYGLMELRRHKDEGRINSDEVRCTRATIDYTAPSEGIYSLRIVPRSRGGKIEKMGEGLSSVKWTVVYDRTPPVVKVMLSKRNPRRFEPGSKLRLAVEIDEDYPARSVRDAEAGRDVPPYSLEVSHNNGRTWSVVHRFSGEFCSYAWEVKGPNTSGLLIRAVARDAAGNLGYSKPVGRGLRITGFAGGTGEQARAGGWQMMGATPYRTAAHRTYQRGVAYMTRGSRDGFEKAVEEFEKAIAFDAQAAEKGEDGPRLVRAYVDLSATYLHLWQMKEAPRAYPNNDCLVKVVELLGEDALKIRGFDREVSLHYNLAQALERLDRLEEAAARLARGLSVSPRHLPSLYAMAYVHWRQRDAAVNDGKLEKAAAHAAEAKKLWVQVAALGGKTNALSRQAVRCLAVLERIEQEQPRRRPKRRPAESAEAMAPPGGSPAVIARRREQG
jgi:tetratricopeptide (TPR) repeat protein